MESSIKGLAQSEVEKKRMLGLVNSTIDSYSPSYFRIFFNNVFSVITISLIPLMIGLVYFGIYREVLAFSFYILISSFVNTVEEIRVKRKLEALKNRFQSKVRVIRDGKTKEINSSLIVQGDYILAKEGEGIVADGKVVQSEFLQMDESTLTGESDYIEKVDGGEVKSGSYVVTGQCIYLAEQVGDQNYLNQLGAESTEFKEIKSGLEKTMQKIIYFFSAIALAILGFHLLAVNTNSLIDYPTERILLSATAIVVTAIPQTLLIILILAFVVSITRLAQDGILVQKRGAIDDMAVIDTICMDKTGTITTNDMKVSEVKYINLEKSEIDEVFTAVKGKLYGENKTLQTLYSHFVFKEKPGLNDFDQIPFTSKAKYSAFQVNGKTVVLGALSSISKFFKSKKHVNEIDKWIKEMQQEGRRVVIGLLLEESAISSIRSGSEVTSNKVFGISIAEELNPGIHEVLEQIKAQDIDLKIISGDSADYVARIAKNVNLDGERVVDMSKFKGKVKDIIDETVVFARATPRDKVEIVSALQAKGRKVAMIGDGVNDVLGLKQAEVGVAMESGSKVTREISDIILLENDYRKIPTIFYEGNNIIFNVKITSMIFMTRTFLFGLMGIFFSLMQMVIPIYPTSTLVFSFLGNSLGAYALMFARQNVTNKTSFFKDVFATAIPSSLIMVSSILLIFYFGSQTNLTDVQVNTGIVLSLLGTSVSYTLILLMDSGKVAIKPWVFLTLIGFSFLFGVVQTILPLWQVHTFEQRLAIIGLVIFGAAIIHVILKYVGNILEDKNIKRSSFIVPPLVFIAAFTFPWRDYYAVEPFPINFYPVVIAVMVLTIFLLWLSHKTVVQAIRGWKTPEFED